MRQRNGPHGVGLTGEASEVWKPALLPAGQRQQAISKAARPSFRAAGPFPACCVRRDATGRDERLAAMNQSMQRSNSLAVQIFS